MTAKSKTRKAPMAKRANVDPIFAAIAEHKARMKEESRLLDKLEEAEFGARETYGRRPSELIAWRNYSDIGEYGIDKAREGFLRQPGADPGQIEQQYQNAKARLVAAKHEGIAWDYRAGTAQLRKASDGASDAEDRAAMRMARTKPTTAAGAAALITYLRRDMDSGSTDWHDVALKTLASALTQMSRDAGFVTLPN